MPTTNVTWLPQFDPDVYHPVLDTTANLANNLVTGETHTLTPSNSEQFIVPVFGPFYGDDPTFGLLHTPISGTPRLLVEGTDYYKAFHFYGASGGLGKPVYGGIGFINRSISGQIKIAYRTIGGEWCISRTKIGEILANLVLNPRITYWEQVAGYPSIFPPILHTWNMDDMVGATELVTSLDDIATAIGNIPQPVVNPPGVDPTKSTVALGNVDNFSTATVPEAIAGTADNLFVTPHGVKAAIDANAQNTPMAVSDDDFNRATLGSDEKIYVPELQIRPAEHYLAEVHPTFNYISPIDDNTTESIEIEFAKTIGEDIFNLFKNQGLLQNLDTRNKDNLVAAINEVLAESKLRTVAYEDRAQLRTIVPVVSGAIMVEGLGLFYYEKNNTEPDDDESCFKTNSGAWLLNAMSWDLYNAWSLITEDVNNNRLVTLERHRSRFLQATGTSSLTSVMAGTSASFLVVVNGAKPNGSIAFAQTTGITNPKITISAKVIFTGVVEVLLSNPSATLATLSDGEVYKVFVINKAA